VLQFARGGGGGGGGDSDSAGAGRYRIDPNPASEPLNPSARLPPPSPRTPGTMGVAAARAAASQLSALRQEQLGDARHLSAQQMAAQNRALAMQLHDADTAAHGASGAVLAGITACLQQLSQTGPIPPKLLAAETGGDSRTGGGSSSSSTSTSTSTSSTSSQNADSVPALLRSEVALLQASGGGVAGVEMHPVELPPLPPAHRVADRNAALRARANQVQATADDVTHSRALTPAHTNRGGDGRAPTNRCSTRSASAPR
jgi:hypothetical protein